MNLVSALILFNILIFIHQILIEILTAIVRLTGISYDKAEFQVISLLTGTGFTTAESEGMMVTKQRRKLAQNIMLFAYVFNISFVSVIINIFISSADSNLNEIKMGTLVTFWNIVLIIFLKKTHITKRIIVKIASKISHNRIKKRGNEIIVYDNFGDKVIAEVEIKRLKNGFKNNEITEELLKEKYDIELLEIKRKEEIITHITKETSIQEGDSIIIYGTMKSIKIALI